MSIAEPRWASLYLQALEACGLAATAAKVAGVTKRTVAKLREEVAEFDFACEQAEERFVDSLEAAAITRARDGTVVGVYHQGVRVDEKREYSDTLMVQLLKGRRSRVYGDKREVRHTGDVQVMLAPIAIPAPTATPTPPSPPALTAPAPAIPSTATRIPAPTAIPSTATRIPAPTAARPHAAARPALEDLL